MSAPETLSQARTFDRIVRLAESAGLCRTCAPQLAFGSSSGGGGFSTVKPPCTACTVVMLSWPVVKPNGWKTPAGTLADPKVWDALLPASARRTEPEGTGSWSVHQLRAQFGDGGKFAAVAPGCPPAPHSHRDCDCQLFRSRAEAMAHIAQREG